MNKLLWASTAVVCLIGAGCSKKVAVKAPPPAHPAVTQTAAAPEKPVITIFAASPSVIDHGGQTTLRWTVSHATEVQLSPALGSVQESGSRAIFPDSGTTYTLTATGPGGTTSATTRVDVRIQKTSNMPDKATRDRIQVLLNRLQDAYFDYNKHALRPDAEKSLVSDAQTLSDILKQYPDYKLTVQGYCDERGSEEYNLALGDKRAKETKEYLATLGVPPTQLRTVSFGKEKPVCTDHTEACWQQNRRAHITQEQ